MFRSKLRSLWNGLARRSDIETGMAEELRFHIEARAVDLVESGLSRDDALRKAKLEFGSADKYKEEMRQARGLRLLDELRGDLTYGFRGLRKAPAFSLAAVLTLALGIGANALIFSVVRAVILRPLDYVNPGELVQVWEGRQSTNDTWASFPNFRDWARQAKSFASMAAYRYVPATLSGDKTADAVLALETTDRFFEALGAKPLVGRTFIEGEGAPGREPVVVISHRLWQKRYAGDQGIVGHKVDILGRSYTIIGIMPASFGFPNALDIGPSLVPIDAWVPIRPDLNPFLEDRGSLNFWCVARLKPGGSLAGARAEMDGIAAAMAREYPRTNKGVEVSLAYLQDHVSRNARPAVLMLLGAVGLLLLLACANIANLLLSRAESRRREMAIRAAIGAGRMRLIRQTLTESVLLSALGAAAGLGIVSVSLESLVKLAPAGVPRIQEASIDWTVLIFTSVITLGAGVLFGLTPAFVAAAGNVHDALKRSCARSSPDRASFAVRHLLIAGQVALAVMLLSGAGLLIRSLMNVTRLDPGFKPGGVFFAIFNLTGDARYARDAEQSAFFEDVLRRVRAVPGVESAAVSDSVPLSGINDQGAFDIEGFSPSDRRKAGGNGPQANRPHVSDDYFATMGIRVLQGRAFDAHDRADSSNVAVVSDAAARAYWPGENPIGKRLSIQEDGPPVWHEIVGIVQSTRHFGLELDLEPEIYVPHTQAPSPFMILVVRTESDMDLVIGACRKEIAAIDPQQAGFGFIRAEDLLAGAESRRRFQTLLLAGFALLALFLAAIGIYGVAAYNVRQRTREIGIRVALGARPGDVVGFIVAQGMLTIAAGAIAGTGGGRASLAAHSKSFVWGIPVGPGDVLGRPLSRAPRRAFVAMSARPQRFAARSRRNSERRIDHALGLMAEEVIGSVRSARYRTTFWQTFGGLRKESLF